MSEQSRRIGVGQNNASSRSISLGKKDPRAYRDALGRVTNENVEMPLYINREGKIAIDAPGLSTIVNNILSGPSGSPGALGYVRQNGAPTPTSAHLLWASEVNGQLRIRHKENLWWEVVWPYGEAKLLEQRFNGDVSVSTTEQDGIPWTFKNSA